MFGLALSFVFLLVLPFFFSDRFFECARFEERRLVMTPVTFASCVVYTFLHLYVSAGFFLWCLFLVVVRIWRAEAKGLAFFVPQLLERENRGPCVASLAGREGGEVQRRVCDIPSVRAALQLLHSCFFVWYFVRLAFKGSHSPFICWKPALLPTVVRTMRW